MVAGGNLDVMSSSIVSDFGNVSVAVGGTLTMSNGYIGSDNSNGLVDVSANNINMNNSSEIYGYKGASVSATGDVTLSNSSDIYGYYGGVSVVAKGNVTLSNRSYIHAEYGGISIVAGGDVSLSGAYSYSYYGSYIEAYHGAIGIVAKDLSLAGYSSIYSDDPNPASTVDILVQGSIKLGDTTGPGAIISGSDINLTLNSADSVVSLQNNGHYGSFIWSDAQQLQAATTTINFTARSSGGVFIDGVGTTTTAYGGYPYNSPTSGFFGGSSPQPSVLNADLIIHYGSPNNIATQTIDQFFSNLTDEKKKKGTDDSTDKGNDQNGQKDSNVGQCV